MNSMSISSDNLHCRYQGSAYPRDYSRHPIISGYTRTPNLYHSNSIRPHSTCSSMGWGEGGGAGGAVRYLLLRYTRINYGYKLDISIVCTLGDTDNILKYKGKS